MVCKSNRSVSLPADMFYEKIFITSLEIFSVLLFNVIFKVVILKVVLGIAIVFLVFCIDVKRQIEWQVSLKFLKNLLWQNFNKALLEMIQACLLEPIKFKFDLLDIYKLFDFYDLICLLWLESDQRFQYCCLQFRMLR